MQENAIIFILLGCCYAMTKSLCKLHSFFIRMSILWAEAESSYTFFGQYEVGNNPKMFLIINMFCYLIFQSFNSIPTTLCCSTKYLLHLPLLRFFRGVEPQLPCINTIPLQYCYQWNSEYIIPITWYGWSVEILMGRGHSEAKILNKWWWQWWWWGLG